MSNFNNLCENLKKRMLSSAPDVWESINKAATRAIANQLINELNGVPSKCGKLVYDQVNNMPIIGRVA